jgi:hypothetical protein
MAMNAERNGNHLQAIELFQQLAHNGDEKAMTHLGNKYYNGEGVTVDYKRAMDWYLKAFAANDGDALGNIGVLYRDGKGVVKNRKIAYLLFLITHMEGFGNDNTQIRVNRLLRKEIAELSHDEIDEALCYTGEYVLAYLNNRGAINTIPSAVLPSTQVIRFKDKNWWLDNERSTFKKQCDAPWTLTGNARRVINTLSDE